MQRDALEGRTDAYLVEQGAPSGECSTPLQQSIDVEDYTHNNSRRDDGVSASHRGDMYQTVSDSRSEVAQAHMYSISRMTLRPTMPTFLDVPRTGETEPRDIFEKYQREYEALSDEFHRAMSLEEYCRIKCGLGPRRCNRGLQSYGSG
jgi:hypothetical protein